MASYHINMSDLSTNPDLASLSMLHVAAVNGDKSTIEILLKKSNLEDYTCDVNECDKYGRTPLVYTVFGDWYDCAELLLRNGATVSKEDRDKRTPLHWAAYLGKQKFISLLLRRIERNKDWNTGDLDGRTPLHYAAAHRNVKCLRLLLKYVQQGTLDVTDREKKTALHWSVYYGNFEQVKLLRDAGAKVHLRDAKWNSFLHLAVANASPDSVRIVRYLLKMNRFYSTQKDCEGRTPLHLAVANGNEVLVKELSVALVSALDELDSLSRSALHYAVLRNNVNILNILILSGASLYKEDSAGATPLHYAAKNNCIEILERFLSYEKLEDIPDKQKRTALMWAASEGSGNVLDLMLKNPDYFKMHACDNEGLTALHFACLAGHLTCVRSLISNNANVRQPDNLGQTALFKACQQGHVNVAGFLMNNELFYLGNDTNLKGLSVTIVDQQGHDGNVKDKEECDRTFESESNSGNQKDCVHKVGEQNGLNANPKETDGLDLEQNENNPSIKTTPISENVRDSIQSNGNLNQENSWKTKISATGSRLAKNRKECIRNLEDCNGCTPLHFAAHSGHVAVCRWLLDNGVDPEKKDSCGRTALHGAAFNGHITCMDLMLSHCPKLKNDRDKDGYCALHRAAVNGHLEAVKMLVLEYKCFPNYRVKSSNLTPLDLAMAANQQDMTQFLIDHGGLTIAGVEEVASDTIKCHLQKWLVTRKKTTLKPLLEKHKMLTSDRSVKNVKNVLGTTEGRTTIIDHECNGTTVDQECNGTTVDQECNSTTIDQERGGATVDQERNGTIVDQECDGTTVDPECNGSTIDQECDGSTVDQERNSIIVDQECNSTTVDQERDGSTIDQEYNGTTIDHQERDSTTVDQECNGTTVDQESNSTTVDQERIGTTVEQEREGATVDQESNSTTVEQERIGTTVDQERDGATIDQARTIVDKEGNCTTIGNRDGTTVEKESKINLSSDQPEHDQKQRHSDGEIIPAHSETRDQNLNSTEAVGETKIIDHDHGKKSLSDHVVNNMTFTSVQGDLTKLHNNDGMDKQVKNEVNVISSSVALTEGTSSSNNGTTGKSLTCAREQTMTSFQELRDCVDLDQDSLFKSCRQGGWSVIDDLQKVSVVDFHDENGCTLLHVAAEQGNDAACRRIIEHGAEVGACEDPTLHNAASNGQSNRVDLSLERKSDFINALDCNNRTAFHCAANNGHLEVVKLLTLTYNAQTNIPHKFSKLTALDYAILGHHDNVVQFMIENGAKTSGVLENSANIIKRNIRAWIRRISRKNVLENTILLTKPDVGNGNSDSFDNLIVNSETLKIQPHSDSCKSQSRVQCANSSEFCANSSESCVPHLKHLPKPPKEKNCNQTQNFVKKHSRAPDHVVATSEKEKIFKLRRDWDRIAAVRRKIKAAIIIQRFVRKYLQRNVRKSGETVSARKKATTVEDESERRNTEKDREYIEAVTGNTQPVIKMDSLGSESPDCTSSIKETTLKEKERFKSCFPTLSQNTSAGSHTQSRSTNCSGSPSSGIDLSYRSCLTTHQIVQQWLHKETVKNVHSATRATRNERNSRWRTESERNPEGRPGYFRTHSLPDGSEKVQSKNCQDPRRRSTLSAGHRRLSRESLMRSAYASPAAVSYNFALDTYHPLASRRGCRQPSFPFKTSTRVRPNSMKRGINGWVHTTKSAQALQPSSESSCNSR